MNAARLYRPDFAPNRVASDRGIKAPVDGEDHVGLPGEELLGRDVDYRARAGILADDIARAGKVHDLAADRTRDRRLETARSPRNVNARSLGRRDLRHGVLNPAQYRLGIARERLGPLRDADETADGAQCRGGARETPADQHRRDMRLLLHLVGERHIGGGGVADIENEVGHQPHDVFEIDGVAATGQPTDLGELRVSRRQIGPRLRAGRPGPAQHLPGR